MSDTPERNHSQRRARARRLRTGFLAVTAGQVDGLTGILDGEPDEETLESVSADLERMAQTADSLELTPLAEALRQAAGWVLDQQGSRALDGVVRALSSVGHRATFPPIAVVGDLELRSSLQEEAVLCCEPVRFYAHVDEVALATLPTGLQGVVLPLEQVSEASELYGVPLFPYGSVDDPELPMAAVRSSVRGFFIEPLRLRDVLEAVRRVTYVTRGPHRRVVLLLADAGQRAELVEELKTHGVRVSAAGERARLFPLLGEAIPDLIVLGEGVDDTPAATLVQGIRGLERHCGARVVTIGPASVREAVIQAGAEALLSEQLSIEELAHEILLRLAWSPRRHYERDPVSGALTRPAALRAIDLELARARRTRAPLSTAVIDLDSTKAINARHGRTAGDAALRTVGQTLTHHLRANDVVGRLGSDTFVVALPGCSATDAQRRLQRLQRLLRLEVTAHPALEGLSFSAGVADSERGLDSVLLRADRVLAEARGRGEVGVVAVE